MNSTDASRSRRRLVVMISAAVVALLLAGVGVYGLVAGPRTTSDPPPARPSPTAPTEPTRGPREPAPIPETDDPEEFARAVAEALFGWDTTSGLMPLDYTSVLLKVADPSGIEQAGLASDIAGYFPNRDTWIELRTYSTTQHLEITDVFVPAAWAEAEPGQLEPGTTAYTVEGIRHRQGIWKRRGDIECA